MCDFVIIRFTYFSPIYLSSFLFLCKLLLYYSYHTISQLNQITIYVVGKFNISILLHLFMYSLMFFFVPNYLHFPFQFPSFPLNQVRIYCCFIFLCCHNYLYLNVRHLTIERKQNGYFIYLFMSVTFVSKTMFPSDYSFNSFQSIHYIRNSSLN